MKNLFKDIIKGGVTMFAVGALLAVVAPVIAMAVGIAPMGASMAAYNAAAEQIGTGSHVMWTGAFFGAFGALAPPVQKAYDYVASMVGNKDKGKHTSPAVEITPPHDIQPTQSLAIEQTLRESQHRLYVETRRSEQRAEGIAPQP